MTDTTATLTRERIAQAIAEADPPPFREGADRIQPKHWRYADAVLLALSPPSDVAALIEELQFTDTVFCTTYPDDTKMLINKAADALTSLTAQVEGGRKRGWEEGRAESALNKLEAQNGEYCSFCGIHERKTGSMSKGMTGQICGNCVALIVEKALNPFGDPSIPEGIENPESRALTNGGKDG